MHPQANALLKRADAYRAIFRRPRSSSLLPAAETVLADLRRVCCADRPTTAFDHQGRVDPIATAQNEGKRYVWLRIQQALHLDDGTILRMLDAAQTQPED